MLQKYYNFINFLLHRRRLMDQGVTPIFIPLLARPLYYKAPGQLRQAGSWISCDRPAGTLCKLGRARYLKRRRPAGYSIQAAEAGTPSSPRDFNRKFLGVTLFGSCSPKTATTRKWLAESCDNRLSIESLNTIRKPFFVSVENREQILEKFLKKNFFRKYLTFFQILCIIYVVKRKKIPLHRKSEI